MIELIIGNESKICRLSAAEDDDDEKVESLNGKYLIIIIFTIKQPKKCVRIQAYIRQVCSASFSI